MGFVEQGEPGTEVGTDVLELGEAVAGGVPGGMLILCVFNLRQHHEHGFASRYCAQDEEYLNALPGFEVVQYEK